jgi:hypothetical protein
LNQVRKSEGHQFYRVHGLRHVHQIRLVDIRVKFEFLP